MPNTDTANPPVLPALCFAAEAARLCGVSEQTIRLWEHTGRLIPHRIGGDAGVRVFLRADCERIAAERKAARG